MALIPPFKRTGTGFVNLNKYLKANQGSKVGSAIQSGLQGNINTFKTGLGSAQQNFSNAVTGSALDNDVNRQLRESVLSKLSSLNSRDQVAGIGDNNQDDVITQSDIEKFGLFRAGEYGGPREIENAGKFLNQSQNLQALGGAVNTQGGRLGLLQQFLGGGQKSYTSGQQKLDSLLLGQQDKHLGQVRRATKGITNETQNILNTTRGLADLQALKNKEFGESTKKLVTDKETGERKSIEDTVAQRNAERQAAINNLQQNLASRRLSMYDPSLAGKQTFGLNPNDPRFYTLGQEATFTNVMSPEQQARLEALARLSGSTLSAVPQMAADRYDPSKAAVFNKDLFAQARNQAEQQYNTNLSNFMVQPKDIMILGGQGIKFGSLPIMEQIKGIEDRIAQLKAKGDDMSDEERDIFLPELIKRKMDLGHQLINFQRDNGFYNYIS